MAAAPLNPQAVAIVGFLVPDDRLASNRTVPAMKIDLKAEADILIYGGPKLRPLTWNDLAYHYDNEGGGSRKARTLPMETVLKWALSQPKRFKYNKDGCLCLILED